MTEGQTFSHIFFENSDRQSVPGSHTLAAFRPPDVVRDIRNLNRRGSTLWRPLVSVDLTADEISATGSPRRFAPPLLSVGRDDNVGATIYS